MPHFQHIEYLVFLLLIPVLIGLFVYALLRKKKVEKKIGDKDLVNLLTRNYSSSAYRLKFLLLLVAVSLLIVTVANLRTASGSEKISRNGIDVMIALDVSKSMLAQDIKPTRMDRAKQVLSRLIDKRSNDRIGIVVFAGKAYLQMPLTGDHSAAKMYLSAATPETVPTQGTVIGDALKMCYASFNSREKKYKAVVLISDGEDHDEGAVKTAEEMAQEGIVIYTVGIGSPQGATIIDEATNLEKTDKNGNTVITKLNEEELRMIAEKGNGKYTLFQSTDAVVDYINQELSVMDKRNVTDDSLVNYKSYYPFFAAVALIFLLLEIFISENKRRRSVNPIALITLLFICFSNSANAQTQQEKIAIEEGNDAYKKNDYKKASDLYGNVVKDHPENATAQFNMGNALYKSGKKDDAVNAYDKSLKQLSEPAEKSNAYYNKGVVLQNDKKLPDCIKAYKNALKLEPGNEDARQNLQKALQQQQQQQKKQDQQKEEKKQDKKQDQDKKQEPKPQQSKLSKKDAEEKLKALMQQEKNLQDKLHKVNAASANKPDKDW